MYGKIFGSIYDGTLSEDWRALITFQQLIVLCDADGMVDMTPQAIARRTGIPIEHIIAGIEVLEKNDKYSRTPDDDGKRIELIDAHRPWGWHIINHEKYKNIQDAETVRTQTRERVRKHRRLKAEEGGNVTSVTSVTGNASNAKKRYIDIDIDTDTDININTNIKQDQNTLVEQSLDVEAKILDFLIEQSGKRFKHVPANIRLITARLKEGHSHDDITSVIERKIKEWQDDVKMAKYIRPATLFNAEKFNQYVGELGVETPEDRALKEREDWINDDGGEGYTYEQ